MKGWVIKMGKALEIDCIVHGIVRACDPLNLTRPELEQLVIDHLKANISGYVDESIRNLSRSKKVQEIFDERRGRPFIQYIAT